MVEQLNNLLAEFHASLRGAGAGTPAEFASQIHSALAELCHGKDQVVEAHKDNGRIIRFSAIGPLRNTSILYSRSPFVDYSSRSDHFDEKFDLGVIERFSLGQS